MLHEPQGTTSHSSDPPQDSFQDCLCLICRQVGHVVELCPWLKSASTDIRTPRPSPPFQPASTNIKHSGTALCDRCKRMDALSKIPSHRPFVLDDYSYPKRASKKMNQIPSLGPITSLRLLSSCPLCRLLFDITYLTEEDVEAVRSDLLVVTGWTMYRFEKDLYWSGCRKGKGPYAKCAYTSSSVGSWSDEVEQPNVLVEEAMDAIGLTTTEARSAKDKPALGVRKVNPQSCDYALIKDWLRRCDDRHPIPCHPIRSEGLKQIKLIDVETRQIVQYPSDGCDYIALSYVWGGVDQPSFRLGDVLPTVPATLEDAMVVTRNLGMRYFWADSLCIDQGNKEEKAVQIALMSAIYTGAWATIICLSGRSARSGLPRVGTVDGVIPQLSCEVWGKQLLSVMPTLPQQMSWSPWATRAWTFQEGLLSPRRIIFTNHQVYFECNAVQCCESLDDSHSPFHLLTDTQRQAALDNVFDEPDGLIEAGPEGILGRGTFRDPFRPLSAKEDAQLDTDNLETYLKLVHTYTTRKMSYDADSLNAFSAVLTRLAETQYKKGFIQGLPLEDLPRALLWIHEAQPKRRDGFAAWSWAGWEGPVKEDFMEVHGISTTNFQEVDSPPLRVWKAGDDGQPELIYDFNPTSWILEEMEAGPDKNSDTEHSGSHSTEDEDDDADSWKDMDEESCNPDSTGSVDDDSKNNKEIDRQNDPVTLLAKEMLSSTPEVPERIGSDELSIEGIVIRLTFVDVTSHYSDTDDEENLEKRCLVHVQGQPKPSRLKFFGYNAAELVQKRSRKEQEFLLLSRMQHFTTPKMYNALLLLDWNGDTATRVGVANLRLDDVTLLEGVKPEKRLLKLK